MARFCHSCGKPLIDNAAYCPACGEPVAPDATSTEPRLRSFARDAFTPVNQSSPPVVIYRERRSRVGLLLALLVAAVLLAIWLGSKNESSTGRGESAAAPTAPNAATGAAGQRDFPIPEAQRNFTAMIGEFIPLYNGQDTEVRKTNIRFQRKDAIEKYFGGNFGFRGWIGNVERLTTETDGRAALSIKLLGSNVALTTWNNSVSDLFSESTMISRNDPLYSSLMQIREGDTVTVSGSFLTAPNRQDYAEEASLTEAGSMANPEFVVRFTSIVEGIVPQGERTITAPKPTPALITPANEPTDATESTAGPHHPTTAVEKTESSTGGHPALWFERSARIIFHLTSTSRRPDGVAVISGTLLPPVPNAGSIQLDQTVALTGLEATKDNHLTVQITNFRVGTKNYVLVQTAPADGTNSGSGRAVELYSGNVIEMFFTTPSAYQETNQPTTQ